MKDESISVNDLGHIEVPEYFAAVGVSQDDFESLSTSDAILSPGLPGGDVQEGAFSPWASDVQKAFRASGLTVSLALNATGERREIVRKAAEVLLPPVIFLQQAGLAVGLNILANWLYDDLIRAFGNRRVKLEILDVETDTERLHRVTYEGPASQVADILRLEADRERHHGED